MNPLKKVIEKSERLEARITTDQKKLFQHAAQLSGRSLTDFAIVALQETAKRIIQEHEIILLSVEDQRLFFQALNEAPKPNKNLIAAAKRYKKEVQ